MLHHCPISPLNRASLILAMVALLIAPVASNAVESNNIVFALVFSFSVLLSTWILFAMKCKKLCCVKSKENNQNRLLDQNTPTTSMNLNRRDGGQTRDIELTTYQHAEMDIDAEFSTSAGTGYDHDIGDYDKIVTADRRNNDDNHNRNCDENSFLLEEHDMNTCCDMEDMHARFDISNFNTKRSICNNIVWTAAGIVMIIVAFICFANSDRTNYWILHSMWHILAMGSTYTFIKNRNAIVFQLIYLLRTCFNVAE